MKAYRCEHCKTLHEKKVARCAECNYPKLQEISLTPKEYCQHFGHDGGEKIIPGTQKLEGTRFESLEEGDCVIGGSHVNVYSHEYEFKCARCGYTRRFRE